MIFLSGKDIATKEINKLKKIINNSFIKPKLGIIQVGNLLESNRYINHKIRKAQEIGIEANWIKYDTTISENELINEIKKINNNYDGLIVQLPLPSHFNKQKVLDTIPLDKDIDGLTTANNYNFYNDIKPYFIPATANAIYLLLESYNINLKDQKILVIGESDLVGKPIKKLLLQHSRNVDSTNKEKGIANSNKYDILIVAAGSPKLIKEYDIKENAIIVDVGITIQDNKIIGDVDFENVKDKVYAISPVPGGVGPLTVVSLLKNLIQKFLNLN